MREKEFINIIQKITQSKYIGDDCAYLKDLGIVVTQDNLAQDIHFSLNFCTPFELGFKSVMVNISDICASGAIPKYLSIGLSLPKNIKNDFIEEFYKGCKTACSNDVEIIGGDLTASDSILISICAIGIAGNRKISSRKNAQIGQKIVVSGVNGSSAAGLYLLQQGLKEPQNLVKSHLTPIAQKEFSKEISTNINEPYAMMDTSDGLLDALTTIAQDSNVQLDIDFDKIPFDKEILKFPNWEELILFGAEDYQLVATIPENLDIGMKIGEVKQGFGVNIKKGNTTEVFTRQNIENKLYNHFEGSKNEC